MSLFTLAKYGVPGNKVCESGIMLTYVVQLTDKLFLTLIGINLIYHHTPAHKDRCYETNEFLKSSFKYIPGHKGSIMRPGSGYFSTVRASLIDVVVNCGLFENKIE
jgi:hypothetical protein